MKTYLKIFREKKWLTTAIIGTLAFSFILITTLNLTLAFLGLIIFLSLAVFQRSFHYGLIFFLAVILIFPPVDIVDSAINTEELFVLVLALIGLVSLVLDKYNFKILPLFYYWAGLIILFGTVLILSESNLKIFYGINKTTISQFTMILLVYPIIIISFQYFFQTIRRLERFFLAIIFVGTSQAIIGIVALSGFFKIIQSPQLENSAWSVLMAITIPITLGMWLTQKSSLSTLKFLWLKKERKNVSQIVDSMLIDKEEPVINLKQSRINTQTVLVGSLILQVIALIVTFSYISLIAIGVGVFIIGVLIRNRKIVLTVLSLLLGLVIILPGFELAIIIQLKQGFLDFLYSLKNSYGISLLWQGMSTQQYQQIDSSYLLIFNKLGLIGLAIFVFGLVQYFKEIRRAYLKSDEFERIWLIVILAVFMEFVLLGALSNAFFAWPAALLFWLLYGALQNLKSRKKEYRLTETRL